jgi:hypothetical protein
MEWLVSLPVKAHRLVTIPPSTPMDEVAAHVAAIFRHGDPTSIGVVCWALASFHPLGFAGSALWALAPDNFLLPETMGAFDTLPAPTVDRILRHPFPEAERARLLRPYVQALCDRLHRGEQNRNHPELWAAYGIFGQPGLPRPSLAAFCRGVGSWRDRHDRWFHFPTWARTWLKCTVWTDEESCTDTQAAYEAAAGSDHDLSPFLNTALPPFLLPARLLRGRELTAAHARAVAFMDVPDYVWEDGVERVGHASYDAVITDLFEHANGEDASWIGLPNVLDCLPELLRTKPQGIHWARVLARVFPDQLRDRVAGAISAAYNGLYSCSEMK